MRDLSEKRYLNSKADMAYYLGIDGGGSTIRVALIDEKRDLISHFKMCRNSNPTSTGFDYLKETLEIIKGKLPAMASHFGTIIINLAGVGADQQKRMTKQIVKEVFPGTKKIEVYHDAHGSLLANALDESAILVICGTGSVIVGKDKRNRFYRVGGWGYLLGDEASGFWLVKRLFQEYLAYHDGVRKDDPSFVIFRDVFEHEPRDALYRFYEPSQRQATAALSATFLSQSFELAQQFVIEGIGNLQSRMMALKSKVKDEVQSIIYMGGMFESPFFLNQFKQINHGQAPMRKGKDDIEIALAQIAQEKDGRDDR